MLLSQFSSFIEVLSGLYISMCMDDVLKGIWSPKYYDDLQSALKEYYLENHDELIDRIVDTNKEKAESIKKYMKNRASFFFVACLILLLLSGYESNLVTDNDASFQMCMFFLSGWLIFLLLFNRVLFSTKQYTAIAVILLVGLTSLSYWINTLWIGFNVCSGVIVNTVLALLIFPILWQAFVCWMFSNSYRGYIRSKLAKGKESYEQAERGINQHNPDILPQMYKAIYSEESIRSNNAEEAKRRCLDNYLELMENDIAKASDPRSVFKIFFSWIAFHVGRLMSRVAISLHFKSSKTITQQQL